MPINIEIPDNFFDKQELEILEDIFNKTGGKKTFDESIQKITLAALKEYKDMLAGRGLSTRADDIQQYRLFLLINEYFDDQFPSEAEVATMFQLTPTRSRSLIRSVMTKYKYQLKSQINDTLKYTILNDTNPIKDSNDNNKCKLYIPSDNVVEQLNGIIDDISREKHQINRIRKSNEGSRLYWAYKSTYEELVTYLKINNFNWNTDLK